MTISLGLPEFRVLRVEEGRELIEVWVEKVTTHAACPDCHWFSDKCHDWRWDDVWDQPIWDKGVRLWIHKRRFESINSRCWRKWQYRPFAESYASVGKGQPRTYRLDRYIYGLTKRMANTDVVKELSDCHTSVSDNTVGRIYQRLGDGELAGYEPGRVVAIGVDEYSIRKGHKYATIITNPVKHTVIETFPGRDRKTVQAHLVALFLPKSVKLAVIDMRRTFKNALSTVFLDVKIIIDKFHVVGVVIDALDKTRQQVQRNKPPGQKRRIFRLRKLLRTGREKLSDEERECLRAALLSESDLLVAYQLKKAFRAWYTLCIPEEAACQLSRWYQCAEATGLPEWYEAARTIRNWEQEILNYFYWPLTNGFTEGSNNRVKVVKRRGYGYRNFGNLRRCILLESA
jgi:transposase